MNLTRTTAALIALITCLARPSLAQTGYPPAEDHDRQLRRVEEDTKRRLREMRQRMKQSEIEMKRLRRTVPGLEKRTVRIPEIEQLDLAATGMDLCTGSIRLQPLPRPHLSAGHPNASSNEKVASAVTDLAINLALDTAAPGAGTAWSVGKLILDVRQIQRVGSGKAHYSDLRSVLPHAVLAVDLLQTPTGQDPRSAAYLLLPQRHLEPGINKRTQSSATSRRDPLTDALIYSSNTRTGVRISGREWNKHRLLQPRSPWIGGDCDRQLRLSPQFQRLLRDYSEQMRRQLIRQYPYLPNGLQWRTTWPTVVPKTPPVRISTPPVVHQPYSPVRIHTPTVRPTPIRTPTFNHWR